MGKTIFATIRGKIKETVGAEHWLTISAVVLALTALFLFISLFVGTILAVFRGGEHSAIYYGLTEWRFATVIIFFIVVLIVSLMRVRESSLLHAVESMNEDGVALADRGTHGSAREMTADEAPAHFDIVRAENIKSTPFGQMTSDGEEVVCWSDSKKGATGNRNLFLLGTSGSGKSSCGSLPQAITAVESGKSVIMTDPKGEGYDTTAAYFKSLGADVYVLNFKDPNYSDCWNVMGELIDPVTERIDPTLIDEFVTVYMDNSGAEQKGSVWYNLTFSVMKTSIAYCAYMRESYIINGLKEIYKTLVDTRKEKDIIAKTFRSSARSIGRLKKMIREQSKETNMFTEEELATAFRDIENNAPPFNLAQVYYMILNFSKVTKEGEAQTIFDDLPEANIAKQAFETYTTNRKDSVMSAGKQGARMNNTLLSNERIRTLLSNEGLKIKNIRKKQTVVYVIIDDTGTSMRPLLSVFFTLCFRITFTQWDRALSIAQARDEKVPLVPLDVIIDEFFSCGMIGSTPDYLPQQLSVTRSRQMSITIIVQSLVYLTALYGPVFGPNIQSNCDYMMFLGTNDKTTAEWVSSFVGGEATAMTESHEEMNMPIGFESPTDVVSVSTNSRMLYTIDETRRFKSKRKVLLLKSGEHPLIINPLHYSELPAYKEDKLKKTSLYLSLIPIDAQLESNENFAYDPLLDEAKFEEKDIFKRKGSSTSYRSITNALRKSRNKRMGESDAEANRRYAQPTIFDDDSFIEVVFDSDNTEEIDISAIKEEEKKQKKKKKVSNSDILRGK